MILRKYKPSDCKQISELFYNTVHNVNCKDYTKNQLNAWANGMIDLEEWNKSLTEHYTLVMMEGDIIVGFADIDQFGYLDRLYVHKDYQRKGIASMLCDELEKVASEKVITHSSITAKIFFEKRNYKVIKQQEVKKNGVSLTNYIMEKSIK